MQYLTRFFVVLILAAALIEPAFAKTAAAAKEAEYKRADMNFYWKGDVLKVDPSAQILPSGAVAQKGESYFIATHKKAPKEIYIEVVNDWIEPITPPSMPTFLNIEPDAMQIREPQGDVEIALPTAPANFVAATDGMTIPNGTVVKTGANGTAAILLGGVNSARLTPNSEAAMQQTVTPQLRTTEIDLTTGAVFSKVGKRIGEKQDYQVHTPFGVAGARGTDFVSIAMPSRVDVWIAQGTVQLDQPDGKLVGTVSSDGGGPLKIIRFPAMPDARRTMMASAETMTTAMNFIPMVNIKVKALRDRMAQGEKLTPQENDYLGRIKKVPCLIKLALVEPLPSLAPPPAPPVKLPTPPATSPAPPVAPPASTESPAPPLAPPMPPAPSESPAAPPLAPPMPPTPTESPAAPLAPPMPPAPSESPAAPPLAPPMPPAPTESPAAPMPPAPTESPAAPLAPPMPPAPSESPAAPLAPPVPTESPAAPLAPPAAPLQPAPEPTPAPAASEVPAPPVVEVPAAPPGSVINPAPIDLELHPSGKAHFQGATLSMAELKLKLEAIAKATPHQPLLIKASQKVTYQQIKKLLKICSDAELPVTFANAESTAPAPSSAAPAVTTPPAALPSTQAHPAMTPRTEEPPATTTTTTTQPTTPPKITKPKHKPATDLTPKPVAPISTGPDATTP